MAPFLVTAAAAALLLLFYGLYRQGLAVINTKTALLYLGTPRLGKNRNCLQATFTACNGSVRRVLRLSKYKTYRFSFSAATTKGSVWVEMYGKDGELAARLSNEQPNVTLYTGEATGYRVSTRFASADGRYKLTWEEG